MLPRSLAARVRPGTQETFGNRTGRQPSNKSRFIHLCRVYSRPADMRQWSFQRNQHAATNRHSCMHCAMLRTSPDQPNAEKMTQRAERKSDQRRGLATVETVNYNLLSVNELSGNRVDGSKPGLFGCLSASTGARHGPYPAFVLSFFRPPPRASSAQLCESTRNSVLSIARRRGRTKTPPGAQDAFLTNGDERSIILL